MFLLLSFRWYFLNPLYPIKPLNSCPKMNPIWFWNILERLIVCPQFIYIYIYIYISPQVKTTILKTSAISDSILEVSAKSHWLHDCLTWIAKHNELLFNFQLLLLSSSHHFKQIISQFQQLWCLECYTCDLKINKTKNEATRVQMALRKIKYVLLCNSFCSDRDARDISRKLPAKMASWVDSS